MAPIRRITADQLYDRRWQLLALTSVGAFTGPLDASIVAVALPVMSKDLHLSFGASMWVQAVYLLTMAVLMIPLGRMADQHGRVRFYLIGMAIFTVGSLLAALSMNDVWLIGSRIVQASGGALAVTTSMAIVTAVFPPTERGKAIGINVMSVYIGLSIGPPLGGLIADTIGWRWIFLVNLPIGLAVLIWGWMLLPRDEERPKAAPRMDLAGAALLGVFLIALLVPLTFGAQWGWTSPRSLVSFVVSALALVGFVIVELRTDDPVLDLDLLVHNRVFATANVAALLNYLSLYGGTILTAVYLEIVQGRSASLTGLLMLSQPIMQAVLAPLAGRWSDRVGSRVLATSGMVIAAAGLSLLATLQESSGMGHVVLALILMGTGLGLFSAPNSSAIVGSVRRDQLGLASGFLSTMRVTGQALSIAVLGGIAAGQLGVVGARILFNHGGGAESLHLARHAVDAYQAGYSAAMWTGTGLALIGAVASLTRGPSTVPARQRAAAEAVSGPPPDPVLSGADSSDPPVPRSGPDGR